MLNDLIAGNFLRPKRNYSSDEPTHSARREETLRMRWEGQGFDNKFLGWIY